MPLDNIPLGEIRRHLHHLVALADTGERPRPTRINGADHPMPGQEWVVVEDVTSRAPHTWWVRTAEGSDRTDAAIYLSTPESMAPGEDYDSVRTADARRIALAILAACDRADHLHAGVTRLADHRTQPMDH
ncbi:hypothetical protein [Streptomyces albidoflavus]|uniref:hypothetical protein n=1 Tax=Streptomyces albidoflavus TaxID=1886 RepID=UPI0010228E6E|nr:hypothetical protein [Streptomyces albidoflavus]RZF02894.1 hypothetical protein C0R05_32300 [Streptomyces albidoflavus]